MYLAHDMQGMQTFVLSWQKDEAAGVSSQRCSDSSLASSGFTLTPSPTWPGGVGLGETCPRALPAEGLWDTA